MKTEFEIKEHLKEIKRIKCPICKSWLLDYYTLQVKEDRGWLLKKYITTKYIYKCLECGNIFQPLTKSDKELKEQLINHQL